MSEEQEAIADVRDAFTKGRTYLYTQTGDIVCNIAELLAAYDDLRTQLAAAREALSNANERALAYDDELRTLRHRAETAERERDAYKANLPEPVAEIVAGLSDDKHALLRKVEEQQGTISSLLQIRDELRHRAERLESQMDAVRSLCAVEQDYTAIKALELLDDASAGEG